MRMRTRFLAAAAATVSLLLCPGPLSADTFYIDPGGNNGNSGSIASPWGTFDFAIDQLNPGDTLLVRGGTYNLNARIRLQPGDGGTAGNLVNIWAFDGETPILDFANMSSGLLGSSSGRGIQIDNDVNYIHMRGLTIQNAKDNGLYNEGDNNTFDQLVLRWNADSGLQLDGDASNNLIVNSDSYENYDPHNNGENADGFAAKFRPLGSGNVFRGDRAWGNSDDGWDMWEAASGVVIEDSWAWANGINIWNDPSFAGDGNGIKLGKDSGEHILRNVAVWDHPSNGVDVNGNATEITQPNSPIDHGVRVLNVTAYNNGNQNFRFDESFPHVLRNNISFDGSEIMLAGVDHAFNTWNIGMPSASAADFLSLDDTIARGPRNPDGSLPISDFLRLAPDSNLIDAGTDVGLPFEGPAPDLGAFEFPTSLAIPGDVDSDGDVDDIDYATVVANYGLSAGATLAQGDANGDGAVNLSDISIVSLNFGAGVPESTPLPEPALALPMLTALAMVRRLRAR